MNFPLKVPRAPYLCIKGLFSCVRYDDCDAKPANRGRSVCFGMNYYFIIEPQCIIITQNDSAHIFRHDLLHGTDGGTSSNNMSSFIFMKRTHFVWAPFISWQMRRMTRQTRISNLIFQSSFCRFTFRLIFRSFFSPICCSNWRMCILLMWPHQLRQTQTRSQPHACATNVPNSIQLNCGFIGNCIGNHTTHTRQRGRRGRRTTIGATGENLICKLQMIFENVCEH